MSDSSSALPIPRHFVLYFPIGCSGGNELCATVEGIMCERLGEVYSRWKEANGFLTAFRCWNAFAKSTNGLNSSLFPLTLAGAVGAILEQASIACAIDGRMQMVAPLKLGENGRKEAISDCSEHALTALVLERVERRGEV